MRVMPVMTAADIMRPIGFVLRESDDVWAAAKKLFESGQAGAIVLDSRGRLSGVLSQSDLAEHLRERSRAAPDFYAEPDRDPLPARPSSTVGGIMSRVIVQVPGDMPVEEIERHMLRRRVQRVIVVQGGEALGVIAATDVLSAR